MRYNRWKSTHTRRCSERVATTTSCQNFQTPPPRCYWQVYHFSWNKDAVRSLSSCTTARSSDTKRGHSPPIFFCLSACLSVCSFLWRACPASNKSDAMFHETNKHTPHHTTPHHTASSCSLECSGVESRVTHAQPSCIVA